VNVSVVIATAYRDRELRNALRALAVQSRRPDEVIVVDGAPAPGVESLVASLAQETGLPVSYDRTAPPSAAVQRNVGAARATGDAILFLDDDAYPVSDCLEKMMRVLQDDSRGEIGGVGVLISNQPNTAPSPRAKRWFDFLAGECRPSYSGAIIGPAVNIGPEPTDDGRIVEVEWLNSGCTAYRAQAFNSERFRSEFHGYSFMEDVDLSVRIARRWRLVVHTGTSIYHDTGPSRFKAPYARAKMSVSNRYHVMTQSLGRRSAKMHAKFLVFHAVSWASQLARSRSLRQASNSLVELMGMMAGMLQVAGGLLRSAARGRSR
jgi:GT2 family glycosyltransferase